VIKELAEFYQVTEHSHKWVGISILATEILYKLNYIFCDINNFSVVVGGLNILRANLYLVKLFLNYFKLFMGLPFRKVSFSASYCHALLNNFGLFKWIKHRLSPSLENIRLIQIDFLRICFPLHDLLSELYRGGLSYFNASDANFCY